MPRTDTTLVPLTVTSLDEVEVSLSAELSAKIVKSDRPGFIAIKVTAEATAEVSYEDTDSIGTPGEDGYESATIRQENNRTKVFSRIVYIAIGEAQAACSEAYAQTFWGTVGNLAQKLIEGTPPRKLLEAMPVSDSPAPLGLGAWPQDESSSVFGEALKQLLRRQEARLFNAPTPNVIFASPPRYGKDAFLESLTAPNDGQPVVRTIRTYHLAGETVPLQNQYVGPSPTSAELEQIRISDCHL